MFIYYIDRIYIHRVHIGVYIYDIYIYVYDIYIYMYMIYICMIYLIPTEMLTMGE